ncbi:MAG: hypothetical protein U0K78_06510 [Agathobacter sp.]|uniref:hypothetical protein n=1 Tax=Agathobacter sp. TaxID=2021311 RepID=UPI002E79747E|nr:hypothetical protein [Agathobacter sp.]MEE1217147.1 hypothetical protein [Agathobacter sp.]
MKKIFESCKKINKKHRVLASVVLASVIIVGCISVKPTLAYFTTYASAKGGVSIDIGPKTRVKEKFKDWEKIVQIENTGKVDCFVRCKVIAASQFTITASGDNWSLSDDGYWYYSKVVPVGEMTEPITAYIKVSEKVKTNFNVVVVQECTPVTYDENGNPCVAPDAKWDAEAQYDDEEGGK